MTEKTTVGDAPRLLREAADLIERAAGTLTLRYRQCRDCGVNAYENRTHWRVNETVGHLPTKLREQANRLENDERKTEADTAESRHGGNRW
jgi:hypothetical protein